MAGTMAIGAAAGTSTLSAAPPERVERWGLWEVALDGPATGNPFVAVQVAARFENGDRRILVPGFYDGDGVYRIRFSPPEPGRWQWRSESNVAALDGRSGSFEAAAPGPGNHGPIRVSADGFHFVHADGTPFRQIGTTAYSWALQSDARCAETLATLKASPFNKIRMLVFPNVPSVATKPFLRTGDRLRDWDPARFDPAYFRRYEDRIRRLGALGIEADIILFHPYDPKRGYSDMRREDDERYLRYVAARFGAFRNVWWSLANEYDLVKSKTLADWDHLFQVLQAADPHDRLRSIHQFDLYYDARKPWVTHASVQNNSAVLDDLRAGLHRDFALKPVIFDEVAYEGNFTEPWGWLKPEEMVERFWFGLLGGTYVGHSETWDPGRNAASSWLGQGGKLIGTSAPRLAFLRRIMEDGPRPGIDPIQSWWNHHIAGRPHEYYLRYFGRETPAQWPVVLPRGSGSRHGETPPFQAGEPSHAYRAEIIDTWNMTIEPVDGLFRLTGRSDYELHDPARPVIVLPARPYLAVRLVRA
jgi:hypothetical protein